MKKDRVLNHEDRNIFVDVMAGDQNHPMILFIHLPGDETLAIRLCASSTKRILREGETLLRIFDPKIDDADSTVV